MPVEREGIPLRHARLYADVKRAHVKNGSVEFRVGHLSVIRAAAALYSSLSLWERAGVRAGSTCSLPPRPHPNPLPGGEGIKSVVLGILAPTRSSTKPEKPV